jgi:hypothetical protein
MTLIDTIVVVLAILQVIAVALMAFVGVQMLETARRGQQMLSPALLEVKALTETGKAVAEHAREDGLHIAGRIKNVAAKVRQRWETTRKIIRELKPQAQATTTEVQRTQQDVATTTATLRDLAERAGRVRNAVSAASAAARNGSRR